MPSTTAAGTGLAISAANPATQDAAGYGALSYTDISNVEQLGGFGASTEVTTFQPLRGAQQKHKGPTNFGALNPTIALDETDAGQALLAIASGPSNSGLYAIRVTKPDGSLRYFLARVFGMPETIGAANSMITAAPVIEINTPVVKVGTGPLPAPVFTVQPSVSPASGPVGTTFTASDGAASNASSYARRWLLNGAAIGTGTTVTPNATGSLVLEVTATGAGGTSSPATSTAATVSAAATPAPAFTAQPSISPTSGAVGTTFTANDGAASNATSYTRRWLLGSTAIGTGTTVTPNAAGTLTLEVTAAGPGGSTPATTSGVTVSAAPTPTPSPSPTMAFASPTATVAEGNSGTTTVTNTVNVARNGITGALTIALSYGGTATAGVDYATAPTSLTISAGQSSGSFDILVNGDTTVEPDETIVITAALSGYAGVTATKTITITNDDVASVNQLWHIAGQSNPAAQGTGGFVADDYIKSLANNPNVMIWNSSGSGAWERYKVGVNSNPGGTADYWGPEAMWAYFYSQANPTTLIRIIKQAAGGSQLFLDTSIATWHPDATAANGYTALFNSYKARVTAAKAALAASGFTGTYNEELFWWQGETEASNLSAGNSTGAKADAYGTNLPYLFQQFASQMGISKAIIGLIFDGTTSIGQGGNYPYYQKVRDAGVAVAAASGGVIRTLDLKDRWTNGDVHSASTPARQDGASGTGAKLAAMYGVTDFTLKPMVKLSGDVSKSEGNNGVTTYDYTVTRSTSAGSATVAWGFLAGTTNAADYPGGVVPSGGNITFADGETVKSLQILVQGDTEVEPNEDFSVYITPPIGYAAGPVMSAKGTILNDDSSGVIDTDAQALFAAMTVQPSASDKQAISDFYTREKAAGRYTKIQRFLYYPMHDEQAAKLEWKTKTAVVTPQGTTAPVFTPKAGWALVPAQAQYLDTGIVHSAIATLDSCGWGEGIRASSSTTDTVGASSGGQRLSLTRTGSALSGGIGAIAATILNAASSPPARVGSHFLRRTASTGFDYFYNGAKLASPSSTSANLNAGSLWKGRNGTTYTDDRFIHDIFTDGTWTDADASGFYASRVQLDTDLGVS